MVQGVQVSKQSFEVAYVHIERDIFLSFWASKSASGEAHRLIGKSTTPHVFIFSDIIRCMASRSPFKHLSTVIFRKIYHSDVRHRESSLSSTRLESSLGQVRSLFVLLFFPTTFFVKNKIMKISWNQWTHVKLAPHKSWNRDVGNNHWESIRWSKIWQSWFEIQSLVRSFFFFDLIIVILIFWNLFCS